MLSTAWIALYRQAARELRQDERTHPLAHLVNIHVAHHVRLAVGREQPVHQRLQAVGLVDDHPRVFGEPLGLHLHLQQLRRTADAAQWILDLVRQVADELLVGLRLIERPLLALLPSLLFDLDQLHDHGVHTVASLQLVDDHVHGQGHLTVQGGRTLEQCLQPAGGVLIAHDRAHDVAQGPRVDEPVEQRAPQHAAA
jgi:hypothetical protein